MSRRFPAIRLPIAALVFILSTSAMAWTPYGYGPYGPGYQEPDRQSAPPQSAQETDLYGPGPYSPIDPYSAYGDPSGYGYGHQMGVPPGPYGGQAPDAGPPQEGQRGYGPPFGPPPGFPWESGWGPGRGSQPGFRISRDASDEAYTLTIELGGTAPEEVRVTTQGQWLVIGREQNEQKIQKDTFDDGRGYMHSYSYSTGTRSRRLSVPHDGDLSAMTREDGEDRIVVRIPRRRD